MPNSSDHICLNPETKQMKNSERTYKKYKLDLTLENPDWTLENLMCIFHYRYVEDKYRLNLLKFGNQQHRKIQSGFTEIQTKLNV